MAVNNSRQQRSDLIEGATDGKYRKARPDTVVAPMTGGEKTASDRSHLHPEYNYGFVAQEMPLPRREVPGV